MLLDFKRLPDSEGEASPLRVYLLGAPRLTWGGQPFSLQRRQLRALFYVMAANSPVSTRDELSFLFWSDISDADARRNLTRLLSNLRRELPDSAALFTEDEKLGLDRRYVWVDAVEFSNVCLKRGGKPTPAQLGKAVQLYRAPFLYGFSLRDNPEFDAWLTNQRQAYERIYLEALSELVSASSNNGDLPRAIDYARQYLETDDLAEDMHRRLIELYAASGDRSAALRQYELCTTILERELGVSPLPETQVAYRKIHLGNASDDLLQSRALKRADQSSPKIPYVGNEFALARLDQAYWRAQESGGNIVLVWGEAGAGKSNLLEHFTRRLPVSARLLSSSGYPDTRAIPYQPILQALRPIVNQREWDIHLEPTWLSEVSRLLPEINIRYPNLPPPLPLEPEPARSRLIEALCKFVLALIPPGETLVLVLDDLHLADFATLDWLGMLGRRLRGVRLLVIGAYNPEQKEMLTSLRQSLLHAGILQEIELDGLDQAASSQIMEHFLRRDGGPDRLEKYKVEISRLNQAAGGNPFYLIQILRALTETLSDGESNLGLGAPLDLEALPISDALKSVVEHRLGSLSPIARQVLDSISVLGSNSEFEIVQTTCGRRGLETLDGLEELVSRWILIEQDGRYSFRHEILRETVYRHLSHWRKRLLHRRASEALLRLQPNDSVALTRHLQRSEQPGKAARRALQAGQAAQKIFAIQEAGAFFNLALHLLDEEGRTLSDPDAIIENRKMRIQVLDGRGWVTRLVGDMGAYSEDLAEVERLAALLGDPSTMAYLRWCEALYQRWYCRYPQARRAAREGAMLSREASSLHLEARCLQEEGLAAREEGDYWQAQQVLDQALNNFRMLNDISFEIHITGNLSRLFWYTGDTDQALRLALKALERCQANSLTFQRRIPLGDLGAALLQAGELLQAERNLSLSLEIARRIDDRSQVIFCLGHLGWLNIQRKLPADASRYLDEALDLAQRIDSPAEQSWLQAGLAEAGMQAGETSKAKQYANQSRDLARAHHRPYDEALALSINSHLIKSDL